MSARKSAYTIVDVPCDGGQSPNAYVPKITAEIRVHYPPSTVSFDEVMAALQSAHTETVIKIYEHLKGGST